MIRPACQQDAEAIAGIYNHYIENTEISFEETPVSADEIRLRMGESNPVQPWIVAESDGRVIGYAYAGAWNQRAAYRHSVETSVYLDVKETGKGIGRQLYQHLIELLKEQPVHAVIGGVALPNAASVGLHESLGFEKIAHYREVGRKFGRWIDVAYWELILDET
jgi:L-amino acid N-acyltransferase YncA